MLFRSVEVEVADVKPSLDRSREKGDIDEEGKKTKSNKMTRVHYENKKNYEKNPQEFLYDFLLLKLNF